MSFTKIRRLALISACSRDPQALKARYLASAQDYVSKGKIAEAALEYQNAVQVDPRDGEVRLTQEDCVGIDGKLRFQARCAVIPQGGTVELRDGEVVVTGADSALVLVAIATNFRRFDDVSGDPESTTRAQIKAAATRTFDALRTAHVMDHQKLFKRVTFDLPATRASEDSTSARIRNSQTSDDPQLAALYFQYVRYLLISCSRPGTQPANLQGLWNDKLSAPWGSKYTININTEMNYWPAEAANLAECPFTTLNHVFEVVPSLHPLDATFHEQLGKPRIRT
jgi:alpha-L-fucosidase 2